ncbi:hypothetical protein GF337_20790, partial [candidate division KSB1 bacterium]|nr:hypothetical protein [candidate division KSB1 bacterium]
MRTKKITFVAMVTIFVVLGFIPKLTAQAMIWSENFTYPDGTFSGSGGKWSVDTSNCSFDGDDHFEVRDNRIEGNDLDGEAIWTSESIDISGYSDVSISVDLREVGSMESSDYIRLYYKLDGGSEILFSINGDNTDDFTNATAEQTGLNGNDLVIVIRMSNSANDEKHRFDDVLVEGYEPGNPGSPTDNGVKPVWVDGNPDCGDAHDSGLCDCATGFKPTEPGLGTFTYPDGVNEV